jgi:hypothetical protein
MPIQSFFQHKTIATSSSLHVRVSLQLLALDDQLSAPDPLNAGSILELLLGCVFVWDYLFILFCCIICMGVGMEYAICMG